jgi:2-oxoisovalerate dehydrogenase E1 component
MKMVENPSASSSGNVFERLHSIEQKFLHALSPSLCPSPSASPSRFLNSTLTPAKALECIQSQFISRLLDLEARTLKEEGTGFYTIASAGHEGNVVVGDLLRLSDYCLLHYRSGALVVQRARKAPSVDIEYDTLLALVASAQDPIAGGRHKVFGSKILNIPPQTSTISSHIPKAVGLAYAFEIKKRKFSVPDPQALVCCSFGDASANHSTLLGALNTAQWMTYSRLPLPLLLVCEDNGIGISVQTPENWIENNFKNRHGLLYFQADSTDLIQAYQITQQAIDTCRNKRCPVFLHLKTVRLGGHAGSDVEIHYRSLSQIEAVEQQDPLLASTHLLLNEGLMTAKELRQWYLERKQEIRNKSKRATQTPKLQSPQEITKPLRFPEMSLVSQKMQETSWHKDRLDLHQSLPETRPADALNRLINWGLLDLMIQYPQSFLFGEDVARKGGVYTVTKGLIQKMGSARVFNTLLDEQSILGLAQGFGLLDLLPLPEIQYLAYVHNAIDQIRGEACSLSFFSNEQFKNPMVIRIASMGYQKGFGGHFHNDNSFNALRDIPGLLIALPSRGSDAVKVLRTLCASAVTQGSVSCFLEPIALYFTKDLYEKNDKGWCDPYPPPDEYFPLHQGRCYSSSQPPNLTILTFGNGVYFSLKAAKALEKQNIFAQVVDIVWLNPLPSAWILEKALEGSRVLLVDEGRKTGGISEALITLLYDTHLPLKRVVGEDTYIPLGSASDQVLPSPESIYQAALELCSLKDSLSSAKGRGAIG